MAKKALKPDELMDMIMEDRVVNALTTRISDNIMPQIKTTLQEFREDIKAAMQEIVADLKNNTIKPLQNQVLGLVELAESTARRVDELENESRLDCLVIYGLPISTESERTSGGSKWIPTNPQEDITTTVLGYFRENLNLQLDKRDISLAYRLPRGLNKKHAPIVVRFSSRYTRDLTLKTRRATRMDQISPHHSIYINEFLTKKNSEIFMLARTLHKQKKLFRTWTTGGHVYIRRTDKPDEKPTKISTKGDLEMI